MFLSQLLIERSISHMSAHAGPIRAESNVTKSKTVGHSQTVPEPRSSNEKALRPTGNNDAKIKMVTGIYHANSSYKRKCPSRSAPRSPLQQTLHGCDHVLGLLKGSRREGIDELEIFGPVGNASLLLVWEDDFSTQEVCASSRQSSSPNLQRAE